MGDPQGSRCQTNTSLGYSLGDGLSYGFPSDSYGSVYSWVNTSCGPADSFYEYDSRHVYSSVSHEFAHDLGLMHAHDAKGDLMCGYCEFGPYPTMMDIKALIFMYGKDGFSIPNPVLKTDIYSAATNASDEIFLPKSDVTWSEDTYGVSMIHPLDWTLGSENESSTTFATFYHLGNHGSNANERLDFSVDTNALREKRLNVLDLKDMAISGYRSDLENYPNFILQDSKTTTLGGREAYLVAGTYEDRDLGLRQISETGTVVGDRWYYIQYHADPNHDDIHQVQIMLSTVQIKNQ